MEMDRSESNFQELQTSRGKHSPQYEAHGYDRNQYIKYPPLSQPNTSEYRCIALPQTIPFTTTFCSNIVLTSKYTTWNFLPKFLLESFRKLANAYFLLISLLQCVPMITNTNSVPTNLPVLMFILAVDGVLAIIEDSRRHKADKEANSASCHVLTAAYTGEKGNINAQNTQENQISRILWSELTVGSIVKLSNRETAPADLLILSVCEPDPAHPGGLCYVETKSLDGETNLKLRHACDGTIRAQNPKELMQLQGHLQCEQPNRAIARFEGILTMENASTNTFEPQPVTLKNVILRGCQLRNTEWIYGLVINTGPDTKIMQSLTKAQPKWSSINESVNQMIIWLFGFLCALCAIASTAQVYWITQNESDLDILLDWDPNVVAQWFIGIGYYILLMYQMIPVSLYVTISMVMFIQAIFMSWDLDVYHEELDQRMIVRSMGLNEELGQISYVFSDKTGTLTCNVMEFRKCSIRGVSYGTGTTEIGRAALKRKGIQLTEEQQENERLNAMRTKIPFVNFEDPKLNKKLAEGGKDEAMFFLHLALCHTVIPEHMEGESEVRYSASSPDEQALVCGAKFFGWVFESRGLSVARIRIPQTGSLASGNNATRLVEYKIHDVLEFNSERKRMSVVVESPEGEFLLLTKGADNMVFPLLNERASSSEVMAETKRHLEKYAEDGLRTLTIAFKKLDPNVFHKWSAQFRAANADLNEIAKRKDNKRNKIDILMEELEQDLFLLGATAIEDKLQPNVPNTIANLMKAGMKVWMLTGDKQETAINISYACRLMDNDMDQIILSHDDYQSPEALHRYMLESLRNMSPMHAVHRRRQAVVIDGECLETTLADSNCRSAFISLAMESEAVVCCRVSPSQKAEIVSTVCEENPDARTLAIGDGANDVAMIQRAHVGVGICGQEGRQAVNSSDYAIGQFSFLEKLLLHHGRLNYRRMSVLVGYMFYKNSVMVLAQYFYMFTTGGSGQKFYSEFAFQLYNIAYTSFPIILLGVWDFDVPWSVARRHPELYGVGIRKELFNSKILVKWMGSALFESAVIFFFSVYTFQDDTGNYGSAPMVQYGLMTFSAVVIVVNLKLVLLQMSWTFLHAFMWLLGVVLYIPASTFISSQLINIFPTDYGSFENTLGDETFWIVIPICVSVALLRHIAWIAIRRRFWPEPWHIVQENYVLGKWENKRRSNRSSRHEEFSSSTRIDIEAGIPVVSGSSTDAVYVQNSTPTRQYENEEDQEDRPRRCSSGFAFSYDPDTILAESFYATHRSSNVSSVDTDLNFDSHSPTTVAQEEPKQ